MPALQAPSRPGRPSGPLTADKVCQAIAAALPENAIISDEAQTSGVTLAAHTAGAPRHDVLALTGGAIGQGLPVAVGAAVACPDRPVIALDGEGSAMYTIQSLWTMAREQLDVTVVIFNNRSYAILNIELQRVGADGGGDEGAVAARPRGPEPRLRQARGGHGRARRSAPTPPRRSPTRSTARSPSPARTSSRRWSRASTPACA